MADHKVTDPHTTKSIVSPQHFELSPTAKTVLMCGLGLGVLCLIWIFFKDDQFHTRFWTSILHNSVFFTGIALFALFKYAAGVTAWGGWFVTFKRIWEAYTQFLVVGLILMLFIAGGLWMGYHHLYHWNETSVRTSDAVIKGKSGFLSKGFYTLFTIIAMGVWIYLAKKIRSISLDEDENGDATYSHHKQLRKFAAISLPAIGFMSAACIWLWVMSLDAHWYSTMFAWYSSASLFVSMLALTVGIVLYMKSKGYLQEVTKEHLHDLGKFVFAFSIFWTYLWFSQYMLIWYANVGEETTYFRKRFDHYKVLYYANLVMNFLLPFLILMRNDTKRKIGTLIFVAGLVFLGHWVDFFQMTKPGPLETAHELMQERKEVGAKVEKLETKAMAVHESGAEAAKQDGVVKTDTASSEMKQLTAMADSNSKESKMTIEAGTAKSTPEGGEGHGEKSPEGEGEHEGHDAAGGYVPGFTIPGLLDLGVMLGFLSGFLLFVFGQISKANLQPKNDPYYGESLHHHVI